LQSFNVRLLNGSEAGSMMVSGSNTHLFRSVKKIYCLPLFSVRLTAFEHAVGNTSYPLHHTKQCLLFSFAFFDFLLKILLSFCVPVQLIDCCHEQGGIEPPVAFGIFSKPFCFS